MKRQKKKKVYELYCPYCGAKARLTTCREIYGDTATEPDELVYVCGNYQKGCDAYVKTYKGTNKPYGNLANAQLRKRRILAHRSMDQVIKAGIMDKHTIYDYLETTFNTPRGKFHIGSSGEYYCDETIRIMNHILNSAKGGKKRNEK